MSTKLQIALKSAKVLTPCVWGFWYQQNSEFGGKDGFRIQFTQSRKPVVRQGGNSLLRQALAIADPNFTAIMTVSEEKLRTWFPWWDGKKNVFFVSEKLTGAPANENIPGDFEIRDELVKADDIFDIAEGDATVINVLESFTANPYTRRKPQVPVISVNTNQFLLQKDENGENRPFYRHTELRLVSECPNGVTYRGIQEYVEARKAGDATAMPLLDSQLIGMQANGDDELYAHIIEFPYDNEGRPTPDSWVANQKEEEVLQTAELLKGTAGKKKGTAGKK